MTAPAGARDLAGHEVPGVLTGLGPYLTTEQRGLDQLPTASALAGVERGEDAGEEVLAGDVVGDGGADGTGIVAVPTRRADDPARGLRLRHVGTFVLRSRTLRAERVEEPMA